MITAGWANAFAVVIGLIVGSFLNVIIVRLPRGESLAWPGSHCPGCQAPIRWYDNLPVLSYLMLRGKCRKCAMRISLRYPVVELVTALLFLAAVIRFGWSLELVLRDLPFLAILVAVTFIDLELRIIPDPLSLGGLAWGLLTAVLFVFVPSPGAGASITWISSFLGAGVGFGVFYGLAWVYQRMTGRSGLGGGDIKLLAMLGAYIGISGVFTTILVSSVFGSVVGISWALIHRSLDRRSKRLGIESSGNPSPGGVGEPSSPSMMLVSIPYGPFLVVGGLYHYFLSDLIWFRFMSPM